MSHTGNWHRNPREMALEVERHRATERAQAASVEVTFYQHGGRFLKLLTLHPCKTAEQELRVRATCYGCRESRFVDLAPLVAGPLAHASWPRAMAGLVCSACRQRAGEVAFFRGNVSCTRLTWVGSVSVWPEPRDPDAKVDPRRVMKPRPSSQS